MKKGFIIFLALLIVPLILETQGIESTPAETEIDPMLKPAHADLDTAEEQFSQIEKIEQRLKIDFAVGKKQGLDTTPIQQGLSQIAKIKKDLLRQIQLLHKRFKDWMKTELDTKIYRTSRSAGRI